MRGCKHENADHLKPGDNTRPWGHITVEQFRCIDCGAWLSLGRAAKADPVELATARLVAAEYSGIETDDIEANPLCREQYDWYGPDDGPMSPRAERVNRLYVLATQGLHE